MAERNDEKFFDKIERFLKDPKEDDGMFDSIDNFLKDARESKRKNPRYSQIAIDILKSLGHNIDPTKIHDLLTGNSLHKVLQDAALKQSIDPIKAKAQSITCIPDKKAAEALLETANSGKPVRSSEFSDVVAEFPLLVGSIKSTINTINPVGQSAITESPNMEGTDKRLEALLKGTGFIAEDSSGRAFEELRAKITSSGRTTIINPSDSKLSIAVGRSQDRGYSVRIECDKGEKIT